MQCVEIILGPTPDTETDVLVWHPEALGTATDIGRDVAHSGRQSG